MFVFISYPREFEAVALVLDAELKSRDIDTFLDKKSIDLTEKWRLEIESNIRKAGVFVVLYRPEAATVDRFFRIEVERIQKSCENNKLQRLMTVIFPPTESRDLPPFFRNHQYLIAEAQGDCEDERDGYWIDRIICKIERLIEIEKFEEIEKQKLENEKTTEIERIKRQIKLRQLIARSALTLGAITIILLSISLLNTKEALTDTKEALTDTEEALIKAEKKIQLLQGKFDGEKLCHSLIGKYTLHQNYIFVETYEKDARSTATSATWNAIECIPNKRNGDFILKGEDETDFDIEAIFDGKYGQIAAAKYIYGSEVHIRKDGTLVGRSFDAALDAKTITKFYKDERGNSFNKPMSYIDKKVEEIIDLRNKKHRAIKTSPCIPMTGETGGKITIAFVCPGYTRTMVKDKEL